MSTGRADNHVHSNNSGDARDSLLDACRRAAEIGLSQITFTEHIDFEFTDECYGTFDYSRYKSEMAAAREEFEGRLSIYAGVEIDFQERFRSRIEDFLSDKEFDYILGAAHYVDNLILSKHQEYFPGKDEREAYEPYFEVVWAAVNSGLFDAIAHLDLCKRYGTLYYGPFRVERYESTIKSILGAVVGQGLALELNTSGLRQAPRETFPGPEVLEMYAKLGGRRIVIGSDAHKAEDVGAGLAEAGRIVASLGLSEIAWSDGLCGRKAGTSDASLGRL